jgi:hypothetical protein
VAAFAGVAGLEVSGGFAQGRRMGWCAVMAGKARNCCCRFIVIKGGWLEGRRVVAGVATV